jgi:hypothetical protein
VSLAELCECATHDGADHPANRKKAERVWHTILSLSLCGFTIASSQDEQKKTKKKNFWSQQQSPLIEREKILNAVGRLFLVAVISLRPFRVCFNCCCCLAPFDVTQTRTMNEKQKTVTECAVVIQDTREGRNEQKQRPDGERISLTKVAVTFPVIPLSKLGFIHDRLPLIVLSW